MSEAVPGALQAEAPEPLSIRLPPSARSATGNEALGQGHEPQPSLQPLRNRRHCMPFGNDLNPPAVGRGAAGLDRPPTKTASRSVGLS